MGVFVEVKQPQRKQKGQPRMDNPETLAALDTQDTEQRQTKQGATRTDNPETLATLDTQDTGQRQTKQKTQHRKLKF